MRQDYVDQPKAVGSQDTVTSAINDLETCLSLTESLVYGTPAGSVPVNSQSEVASSKPADHRNRIREITERLARLNNQLDVL